MENVFAAVVRCLPAGISATEVRLPAYSTGWVDRLRNLWFSWTLRKQDRVFHISGDVTYAALILPGRRTAITIHDCEFIDRASGLKRWILLHFWLKWPVRHCHRISVISEATRRAVLEYTHCDPAKLSVIPNPVTVGWTFSPRSFNRECPTILQVGTKANKNVPKLIEAIRGLRCELHIIGPIDTALRQLLRAAGVSYRNYQQLSDKDLQACYIRADIVSLVSTLEGFGLPILEAQMIGRPVITSNQSSMPEVAGQGACLVNPQDPLAIRRGLERIIQDEDYRETLIEKGRQNTKRFAPARISRAYAELYRELGG